MVSVVWRMIMATTRRSNQHLQYILIDHAPTKTLYRVKLQAPTLKQVYHVQALIKGKRCSRYRPCPFPTPIQNMSHVPSNYFKDAFGTHTHGSPPSSQPIRVPRLLPQSTTTTPPRARILAIGAMRGATLLLTGVSGYEADISVVVIPCQRHSIVLTNAGTSHGGAARCPGGLVR